MKWPSVEKGMIISDEWRSFLYPLGFFSALCFTMRMLLQWVTSESNKKSTVTPLFWKLSLSGNLLLAIHAFIQLQYHVYIIQIGNAIISWRNLNLMQHTKKQLPFLQVCLLFISSAFLASALFFFQSYYLPSNQAWFRIPTLPWQDSAASDVTMAWHLIGFLGLALFNSRFWIQWWLVEKYQKSYLGAAFWWISLVGELLCLLYFFVINDPVNFLGPLFALVPYVRNLMLIYQPKTRYSLHAK